MSLIRLINSKLCCTALASVAFVPWFPSKALAARHRTDTCASPSPLSVPLWHAHFPTLELSIAQFKPPGGSSSKQAQQQAAKHQLTMQPDAPDDSQGKHKLTDVRSRSAVLTAALVLGICLGVVASEKLYLRSQEQQHPGAVAAALRSRKLQTGGESGVGSAVALTLNTGASGGDGRGGDIPRNMGEPRNELERVLQRVAPQGEVLIAISNSNLLHGELQMWIEVRQRRGQRGRSGLPCVHL